MRDTKMRLLVILMIFLKPDVTLSQNTSTLAALVPLPPPSPEAPDFNFNRKTYLKDKVKLLIDCILEGLPGGAGQPDPEPLMFSLNETGTKRAVFQYNGSRGYTESCLADSTKKDLIRRLYDASCKNYKEKFAFLDSLSCNASQNLECRKVGEESQRAFAEPTTPIMQCLCPNYTKSQTFINNSNVGFYDPKRKTCVLKVGQICAVNLIGHDKRFKWNDFDFEDAQGKAVGIDVVDLRWLPPAQTCVEHAFCYTKDSNTEGLPIPVTYLNRCACKAGYFQGDDGECYFGIEPTDFRRTILAGAMFVIGFGAFFGGLLAY